MSILYFLTFLSFFLGLLIVLILNFVNRSAPLANRLLSVSIFSLGYYNFINGLVMSGQLLMYPHFFRTGSPLSYLVPATAFLYVWATLSERRQLRKVDFIHFLPAILHFLELIPFYLQGTQAKRAAIESALGNTDQLIPLYEGILPNYLHTYLKLGLGIVYFTWQAFLIVTYWQKHRPLPENNKTVIYWLASFTLMLMVCYGAALGALLLDTPSRTVFTLISILLAGTLVAIAVNLFFRPQILYGFSDLTESKNLLSEIQTGNERSLTLSTQQLADYQKRIEAYLELKKPFLDSDFRMRNMVEETGIPRHHLSAVINAGYGKNFSHFINEYRIKYLEEHFDDPEWANLTLEGIAMEAGFKSRSTFLQAFKKITGMTPSEFREKKD